MVGKHKYYDRDGNELDEDEARSKAASSKTA